MRYSLNEIEAMSKRAARGAGLSWGLAEEAGKAARWLAAHGLPGPEALTELLAGNDSGRYAALAPASVDDPVWRAPSGSLCPLVAGAALCDRAAEIAAGREIELGPTAQPLLLAPFAAGVADMTGAAVRLSWAGTELVLAPAGVSIEGDRAALTAAGADGIRCARVALTGIPSPPDTGAAKRDVDAAIWGRLNAFAGRIFAPATEASRLTGAGAGNNDSD